MRIARDLAMNDGLLGQELGVQAAKYQQGEETSQRILLFIYHYLTAPSCLTNPILVETDSSQHRNLC